MVEILLLIGCVGFFYKMGEMERSSGILWAGISLGLWFGSAWGLGWWLPGRLLTQVVLFVALTAWNCVRDARQSHAVR